MVLKKSKNTKAIVILIGLIALYLVFYVLYIGASFIIPFIISIFLSFAIVSLSSFYKKFVKYPFISFPLSIISYGLIFWLIAKIVNSNIQEIIRLAPLYQAKLLQILGSMAAYFNLDAEDSLRQFVSYIDVSDMVSLIAGAITNIFKNAGIIFIYTLFLLLEYRYFNRKLDLIIKDGPGQVKIFEIFSQVETDIRSYFLIKTFISFLTGLLTYIVLMLFHVDFALFWAFIIFILNYIPTVGSILGVILIILFSLVQFESLYIITFIAISLSSIQVLMGNIIEPKFMGNRLNLSPLVIILSLGFWGIIWGIVGMLISVPMMVIINIVFSKIDATRPIAIIFSEKGEIKSDFTILEKHKTRMIHTIKSKLKKKTKN